MLEKMTGGLLIDLNNSGSQRYLKETREIVNI